MKKKLKPNPNQAQARRVSSTTADAATVGRRRASSLLRLPGQTSSQTRARAGERGYTLVALLALMTIMALALAAAAPNVRMQKQRELEAEAIARGEDVAEAIRLYVHAKSALPTSIDQLLEGIPVGTKKVQILRPSAARDPLSSTGEWKLIKPNDSTLIEFQREIVLYAGGRPVPTRDPHPLLKSFDVRFNTIINTGTQEESAGGEDDSTNSDGPFIGVASRSRRKSVITYYGIERHDKWVFTPLFR